MRKFIFSLCFVVIISVIKGLYAQVPVGDPASVVSSKHNLSKWGPGDIKATTESQVCKFCHAVHAASVWPLWGHRLSTATYTLYSSQSMRSPKTNQPDKASKLCLSCHDGTIAIGGTLKGDITMTDSGTGKLSAGKLTSTSTAYFGTNLRAPQSHIRHPISIGVNQDLIDATRSYGAAYMLKTPLLDVGGKKCLDRNASGTCTNLYPLQPTGYSYPTGTDHGVGIQCTTCHDAHNNQYGMFIRETISFGNFSCAHYNATSGGFCAHCHEQRPPTTLYNQPGNPYNQGNPW